jgi:general secretion pathway protein I
MTEARGALSLENGFTLLEVMIAMAIMLVAFASILLVQSQSLSTSAKAKQMNIVAMLAKGKMIEVEYEIEGKPFNEVKKEDAGNFKDPYQDYGWKRVVKEIKFPNMNFGGGGGADKNADAGVTEQANTMMKLLTNYLSKAIREVTVTVTWKRGTGTQEFSVSTYWVNLDEQFQLSE